MNTQEYEARNLQGFEGDNFIKDELKKLIKKHKLKLIVETGTYLGGTTKQFASMADRVITIEIDSNNFLRASKFLEGTENVKTYLGSSPDILRKICPGIKDEKALYFLDAHWGNVCPLKNELKVIAGNGIRPVIAIHDWVVPGTDFGFDSYNGQPFTYEWIKAELDEIYGEGSYKYYYNTQAEGARRGIIYVEPTKK